jgi:hypothetical protein
MRESDIETFDITNNQLTGQLPAGLFEARNLQTLALSINCFTGSLPPSMCSMSKAVVISLDGLGAAPSCSGTVEFPITKIKLFNTLEGTIPLCVWDLPNLTLFHVAGVRHLGCCLAASTPPSYSSIISSLLLSLSNLTRRIVVFYHLICCLNCRMASRERYRKFRLPHN